MSRESLQPKIEAANNNAAFEVLAANEAAEVGVDQMPESEAAKLILLLMKAAKDVNLKESDPKAGRAKFTAAQEAAAA